MEYHGLSWIIMDYPGLSLIIVDYHRLSWMIMDYHGYIMGYQRLSSFIPDYHTLSWIIMDNHGLSWIIIDYHRLSRIIADYHGLSWRPCGQLGLERNTSMRKPCGSHAESMRDLRGTLRQASGRGQPPNSVARTRRFVATFFAIPLSWIYHGLSWIIMDYHG